MGNVTGRNKISNFTVRITGNILQSSRTFRFLIQSLDRHDREYLVDRPRVGKRLKEREVTEIFIGKQFRQSAEFIGRVLQTTGNLINLTRNRPIQTLNLCTGFQIYDSMTEQVQRFLPDLLRIMPCFQHLVLIQCIPDTIQFLHQFMSIRSNLFLVIPFGQGSSFKYLKDKNGMMCRQCTSTLRYDIRVWDAIFIAHVHQSRNRVVYIFLNGIIHATFTIRRTGSVIIHSQSTTNIDKFDVESHRMQLHIEL